MCGPRTNPARTETGEELLKPSLSGAAGILKCRPNAQLKPTGGGRREEAREPVYLGQNTLAWLLPIYGPAVSIQ